MIDPALQAAEQETPALPVADYSAIFAAAPAAMLVVLPNDPVFTMVAASDAYVRVSGVRREDLVGRGVFEVFPDRPKDLVESGAKNLRASFRRVTGTRAADRMPLNRYDIERPADGEGALDERYWRTLNTPLLGADGSVEYILHSVEDVTGQVLAEQRAAAVLRELQASEERLQFALDAGGGVGAWNWDLTVNRVYADTHFAELFSVDPKHAAAGAPIAEYLSGVHPDDRDRVFEQIQYAIGTDDDYLAEYRVTPKDGTVRWLLARGRCHRDQSGNPVRLPGVVFDITERKNAEEALRKQWNTFDTALSHTPDFTYTFDLEGRFTYVNRALLSLWQKPLEQALGKNFFELEYPPELAERLQLQIQQVIDRKQPLRDQTPFTGAAGITGYYEYIFVPVFAENGRVEAVAGSTRDITERRNHEEVLRKSEERHALMLDLLQEQRKSSDPGMMMRASAESVGRYLNADRLGFFEMRGNDTMDFLAGWTAGRLPLLSGTLPAAGIGTRYLHEVRAGRTIGIRDTRTDPLTADSMFPEIGTASLIGVPIIRHGRWHAGFYVNHAEVRDWTDDEVALVRDAGEQTWDAIERARAEAALRNSEEQLRRERERLAQVFEQAPVAIVVFRGNDLIVELANPTFQALVRGRDLIGRGFAEIAPELGSDVRNALHRVLDTGEPFAANEWHIPYDQDGDGLVEDHWFNLVFHPFREADNLVSGMVAVCSEVTVQVRARHELERLNRDLEEFAYVASHDLQEPLRMVNSYTQLLLRNHVNPDNRDAQEFAAFIRDGVLRMEHLIRDLLSYSRAMHGGELIPAVERATADLNASLAEALAVMDGRITEAGAQITAAPLPSVRGDALQLAHVFQNLLSNALKYRKEAVPPKVCIGARREDGMWVVAVRDNGIGFEQKYADGIFGLFKRLHRDEYSGSGLGLAICQRIVERYQGRIWAESEPGVGSAFFVALPAADV